MKYKTGDCFQVKLNKRSNKWNVIKSYWEAVIKLGKKYPPKKGKADRYKVIVISGSWPYESISVNNLDRCGRQSKAAEVLYA